MEAIASHLCGGLVPTWLTKPMLSETTQASLHQGSAAPPLAYNISLSIPTGKVDNVVVVAQLVNALDNTSAVGYVCGWA